VMKQTLFSWVLFSAVVVPWVLLNSRQRIPVNRANKSWGDITRSATLNSDKNRKIHLSSPIAIQASRTTFGGCLSRVLPPNIIHGSWVYSARLKCWSLL